jgi:phthalate 4,5-dioxygenase oxygenase subunit
VLSQKDNELITRVGPGTPMGELFRRFWLPALITSEIPDPDGPPLRLRLLGEDLVAFRDTNGKVGILGARCPHKLAPLFFGRNEQCGLRCAYHGWKFDVDGTCLDMPNEPPTRQFKERISQLSYPTEERGGVVWIYMGPPALKPASVPQLEWVVAPEGHQHVSKWIQRTNWCQGMEGEIDTSHISFLHSMKEIYNPRAVVGNTQGTRLGDRLMAAAKDGAPRLTLIETPYGFTYGARRTVDDEYYWRVTRWLFPFYSIIPGAARGVSGRCWVPIDDEHTFTFAYQCRDDRPYNEEEKAQFMEGGGFPPRIQRGAYTLPDGYKIDAWIPVANPENDYLIDREMQRTVNFTGIWGINEQDRSLQEGGMGAIVDRSKEHLGTSDVATMSARRLLINMIKRLQQGIEPGIVNQPELYHLRAINVVSEEAEFTEILSRYDDTLGRAKL